VRRLTVDQARKILVKPILYCGRKVLKTFRWFKKISFIENEEWLWGLKLQVLSSCFDCFRLVAVGGIDIGYVDSQKENIALII
jgi:hypothetical protein